LSVLYTTLILTETLFASLVVAFFFCLVDYLKRRQSIGTLVLAGLALSGSVYVRPVGYYLPILVSLVLLPVLLVRFKKLKYLLHALVFLIVSFGPLAAWQVRNRVETGYRGFSAVSDLNLYLYQGASVLAKVEGLPFQEVQQRMRSFPGHPEESSWTEAQRSDFMKREGIRIILQHPLVYAGIHLGGMARILFDPGSVDYLKVFDSYPRLGGTISNIADRGLIPVVLSFMKNNPPVFWTQLSLFVLLIVYYIFAFFGLFARSRAGVWDKIALVAIILYFVAVSGGPHAYSRFRHPAMPFLCVLAGYGFLSVTRRIDRYPGMRDSERLVRQR
jgi:4-amino-4-deoxy-L-arabinose transferase-like glycosyltransferase